MEFNKKQGLFFHIISPCLNSDQSQFFLILSPSSLLLTQDTAGSERYEAMSRIYYRGARAAIVCYGKSTVFLIILERFQVA